MTGLFSPTVRGVASERLPLLHTVVSDALIKVMTALLQLSSTWYDPSDYRTVMLMLLLGKEFILNWLTLNVLVLAIFFCIHGSPFFSLCV